MQVLYSPMPGAFGLCCSFSGPRRLSSCEEVPRIGLGNLLMSHSSFTSVQPSQEKSQARQLSPSPRCCFIKIFHSFSRSSYPGGCCRTWVTLSAPGGYLVSDAAPSFARLQLRARASRGALQLDRRSCTALTQLLPSPRSSRCSERDSQQCWSNESKLGQPDSKLGRLPQPLAHMHSGK